MSSAFNCFSVLEFRFYVIFISITSLQSVQSTEPLKDLLRMMQKDFLVHKFMNYSLNENNLSLHFSCNGEHFA